MVPEPHTLELHWCAVVCCLVLFRHWSQGVLLLAAKASSVLLVVFSF